jgi:DNA invertase Pin-like site-specific DNA recombinase
MSQEPYSVVGYVRVSTAEQERSGAGLEAQRQAIEAEAERRGWHLLDVYVDAASGKSLAGRPALQEALEAVEAGGAQGLIVAKLDRLSRSLLDFAGIVERARKRGWNLHALDLGVDTSTPSGELMANVLASFAAFERQLISERTRVALEVKRSQGVVLGRPREVCESTVARIRELYGAGHGPVAIARKLNEEKIPTPRGGKWHHGGVGRVLSWEVRS